jgi:HEAT repeat protein
VDRVAIAALGRILVEGEDPAVRLRAAQMLQRIDGPQAVGELARGLGDTDRSIRMAVVNGLAESSSEEAMLGLGQVLFGDEDHEVRLLAVDHLARDPGEAAHAFLQAAADDPDQEVRATARQALGIE